MELGVKWEQVHDEYHPKLCRVFGAFSLSLILSTHSAPPHYHFLSADLGCSPALPLSPPYIDLQPYTHAKLKEKEPTGHTLVTLGLDERVGLRGWGKPPAYVGHSMEDSIVTHLSDSQV